MKRRKFGTKWELHRQHVDLQKRQDVAFKRGASMLTFELMMFYSPPTLGHLKFQYDQIDDKWVDENLVMFNVTM